LGLLLEAWKKCPEQLGVNGLVRLARERADDKGREMQQDLVGAEQERRILRRLGHMALPESALAELRAKGIRHLLVIPDGSLHYVPFAMLRVKGDPQAREDWLKEDHYLVEEFAISYTPAMTTLDTIRKQKQEREKKRQGERRWLLAFANPDYGTDAVSSHDEMVTRLRSFRRDYYAGSGLRLTPLPETEKEAMRAASLSGPVELYASRMTREPEGRAVVYTGEGACETEAKRLLSPGEGKSRWKYLLFSVHGLSDPRNGMLSCIALSSPGADSEEDGFLQAQEVLDMELDTDLVMLSACQTGLGRLHAGEGLVGLSAAFFIAGAESVCASLWDVPSGPTSQLVTEFFRHLKEGKLDRAGALRQAQLTVMRQGRSPDGNPADYSAPFCWAAFVMIGES